MKSKLFYFFFLLFISIIISSNGVNADCYSDCVDENREFCKTEWSKCVSLMAKCRDKCDVQLEK